MAITTSLTILKYIKLTSIILLSIYAFHPFINGSGCDFQLQSDDGDTQRYMSCSNGIITAVVRDKTLENHVIYDGIYGRSGDSVLVFFYRVTGDGVKNFDSFQPVYFLKRQSFHFAKYIAHDNEDWILAKKPIYQIYSVKRFGKLGWW